MAISKISSSSIDPNVSLGDGFLKVDSTNNRVGIGTSSPSQTLHVSGIVKGTAGFMFNDSYLYEGATDQVNIRIGTDGPYLKFADAGNNVAEVGSASGQLALISANAERMRIDNSGRVTMSYQPYICGSPTNTNGVGIANSFYTHSARGGMAFSTDRITVPVDGVYHISFNTISDNSTGRIDASIWINGGSIVSMLNEDNGTGYHYKSGSITILLAANDYIQFVNNDWYDATNTGFTTWRTASVALLG